MLITIQTKQGSKVQVSIDKIHKTLYLSVDGNTAEMQIDEVDDLTNALAYLSGFIYDYDTFKD